MREAPNCAKNDWLCGNVRETAKSAIPLPLQPKEYKLVWLYRLIEVKPGYSFKRPLTIISNRECIFLSRDF